MCKRFYFRFPAAFTRAAFLSFCEFVLALCEKFFGIFVKTSVLSRKIRREILLLQILCQISAILRQLNAR